MSSPSKRLLFILSSHAKMTPTDQPAGFWLPELSHPYSVLVPHYDITIASPEGGEAPLDPRWEYVPGTKDDEVNVNFARENGGVWKDTRKVEEFVGQAGDFEGVVVPGGYGPLFDLVSNDAVATLIREFYDSGRVVAAMCHGVVALANTRLSNGEYLVHGQTVTGFSNAEEQATNYKDLVPISVEDLMKERVGTGEGAFLTADPPWSSKVVRSGKGGKLVTAAAAGSSKAFGEAILDALTKA